MTSSHRRYSPQGAILHNMLKFHRDRFSRLRETCNQRFGENNYNMITSGPSRPSCVKGDSRCSAENRKDSKFSCSATQPVLNRPSLKLACVIRSKGRTNLPNLV